MQLKKIKSPFHLILFGASGDLANLKLFPAIYELYFQKRLPEDFTIVGFARTPLTDDDLRDHVKKSVKAHCEIVDEKILTKLLSHVYYVHGQYDTAKDYQTLAQKLKTLLPTAEQAIAYFAVPPFLFESISKNLSQVSGDIPGKIKLMMEKPFGENRKTAGDLFNSILKHFDKESIYLLDHYLGKAAVQSILPLRYNNRILNVLLKGSEIANIQISALETAGVEERIGFFEHVGIVKDMIQSHLLQVLALLTMSMPIKPEVHSIRREKGNILSALRYSDERCGAVLAQYQSYKKQKGVNADSKTPTFAAFRCLIDLTDWYDVPIYIRTGKKLAHKHTYIVIEFKKPPFKSGSGTTDPNRMIIELYPEEKIQIRMVNDLGKADPAKQIISGKSLACTGEDCLPPYGRLILDALLNEQMSFLSVDEILASWHFIDEVMACIGKQKLPFYSYKDGSTGPDEQHELTKLDNFQWYDPDRL